MIFRKYISLFAFVLLTTISLQAQFLDYGTDPARFRWNYVDLPHYRLIFPQGNDSMAYRYALYLENVYQPLQKTIGAESKRRFPVILHPANMQSNGLVAWAPRRMELITTPSSKLSGQSWDKHLSTHESRHVLQTSKVMRKGFNVLYYLIGEQTSALATFFLPQWYLEGDAVGVETAMSNGGRGDLPEFSMPYRAQILGTGKNYTFDQWYMGSYRKYTGNFYALGYNITSYARYRYGADIWKRVTDRYLTHYFHFSPFYTGVKKFTGRNVKGLYHDTFAYLQEGWERVDTTSQTPDYLSPETKQYTSYQYPQPLDKSTVIAVKSGLKDINSLVALTNGREKHLTYLGALNGRIRLHNRTVYWSEIVAGLRWTHENYSVIKSFDLDTKKVRTLTPGERLLSPEIDERNGIIAASRMQLNGRNEVVIIDLNSSEETTTYDIPANAFAKELTFDDKGNLVIVVVNDSGTAILYLDRTSNKWDEWLPTTSANITSPIWHEGKLYFESGLSGTNNIYTLNPSTGKTERITDARFGAFTPAFSPANGQLLFADYQAKGYRVGVLPTDSLHHEEVDFDHPYRFELAEVLREQENFNLDTATLTPVAFHPKPYRKGVHTFNIHSWAPFYYDVSDVISGGTDDFSTIVRPGAMVLSQNALNSAIVQAGWFYSDKHHHGKLDFTYKGWYPVVNLSVEYGGDAYKLGWQENEEGRQVIRQIPTDRHQLEAEARLYIPFNFTRNHYIRGLQPIITYNFTNNQYQEKESGKFRNFQYVLAELHHYNYRRQAVQDILPRWGYQLRLQYLATPMSKENFGELYATRLTTYWPGIVRSHSLMIRAGYQYQNVDDKTLYIPKRLLDKTRGYDYLTRTRQQLQLKADYALPLFYPDWNLGAFVYIKRVRANLFFDYTRNQPEKGYKWQTQSAYGGDLLFDWNVIRMNYPLVLGVRMIQPIDYGKFKAEVLFSFSF
ncbi:hypothetical protein [Parabacteroides sp. PF5-9]|uniref:TolB family protein n=1 Tax=Parabacteroides sp. PF5-9 TaxID=1742404 RepID=UPI00247696DE|nr:hypothetical protein [Parabacteroides sp. PF5-9]MDH6358130.1 hypothetical protein [Parabacteroides sp. PF5-9]